MEDCGGIESTNGEDSEGNDMDEKEEFDGQPPPLSPSPWIDETMDTSTETKAATTTTTHTSTYTSTTTSSPTFFSSMGEWFTQLCGGVDVDKDKNYCYFLHDCFDAAVVSPPSATADVIILEENDDTNANDVPPSHPSPSRCEEDDARPPSLPPGSSSPTSPMGERDTRNDTDHDECAIAVAPTPTPTPTTTPRETLHSMTTTNMLTNSNPFRKRVHNQDLNMAATATTSDADIITMSRKDLLASIRHTADSHKMGKEQYLRLLSALAGH